MKRITVLLVLVICLVGCAASQNGAVQENGNKYVVMFLVDPGIESGMDATLIEQQKQVASWMENDLLRMLNRAGYQASTIRNRSEFHAGPGTYLLQARIERYNPGSQAARMIVGFGAGAASLDINYQIVNGHGKQLVDRADGVGSGRGWTYCCRELNQRMLNQLSANIGQ